MLNFACRTKEEHLQVIDFIIFFLYILTTITSNNYLQLNQISSYCLYIKNNKREKMAVLVLGGFIIGAIFMYSVINLIRGKE
jgi:hypothetical protein